MCLQGVQQFPANFDALAYNFDKGGSIFMIFFSVKFRKDLRRKMQLKSPPPLKSAAALPCEIQVVNYTAFTA